MQSNYKYAKTLFDLSIKTNSVNKIKNELKAVAYLYNKVPAFRIVFITKRIDMGKKSNILRNALKQFEPLVVEFISILINNNQTNNLLDIISRFNKMSNADSSSSKVEIITANEIENSQVEHIQNAIYAKLGFKPKINKMIDSKLIGGMKLRIGNKIFDNSISYQINQLKKTLHNM